MDSIDNASPVIEENAGEVQQEIAADELFENITSDSQEEEEQAEQPAEGEQQEEEPELTPEEAQKKAITDGLQMLFSDGWTQEELLAFSKDKTVRADIAGGKDIMRAAMAYERRQRTAPAKTSAKKGVPTLRSAATSGAKTGNRIAEMTDAEFDAFSKRAKAAMLEGKLVSFN